MQTGKSLAVPSSRLSREIAPGLYDTTSITLFIIHRPKKNVRRRGCECSNGAELRHSAVARRGTLWLKAIGISAE